MKVFVDQRKCVSAGNCAANAPGVFDQSEDDGTVVLLDANPGPDQEAGVRRAVAACPAHVISIEE